MTRQSVHARLDALLRRGFTTTCAGGFFFVPYLLELDAAQLCRKLAPDKQHGIPPESLALQVVHESIFGFQKGIRSVDPVSQKDFGALCGLPFLCSVSTEYRFLQTVPIERSDAFQIALGQKLVKLGRIRPGQPVNLDAHCIPLYSRKEMRRSYIGARKQYGKAIRTFYTQDQESRKPLFVKASYSGTTASQATGPLMEATQKVLGKDILLVADKEWYVARLLEEIDQTYGVKVLIPLKRTPRRMKDLRAIPLDQFRARGDHKIAALFMDMDGFSGKLKLFVKLNDDGSYFGLITNKKYLRAQKALTIYTHRWRIENWFKENLFLGLNRLPSLELNAIQAVLSLRLLAYQVLDNFRADLPPELGTMTPELIHRHFIQNVQGKVQLRRGRIQVDIYGFRHREAVEPLFTNTSQQLVAAKVDPRVPWLNSYPITYRFV